MFPFGKHAKDETFLTRSLPFHWLHSEGIHTILIVAVDPNNISLFSWEKYVESIYRYTLMIESDKKLPSL